MRKYWAIYIKNSSGKYTSVILHDDKDSRDLHYDTIKTYGGQSVKHIGSSIKAITMKQVKEFFPNIEPNINPKFWI